MISVIIPNYNGEKTIERTIGSVYGLGKLGMSCEIIVVDDCSTDNSVKMIEEKFPKVRILKNERVRWVAYSRNRGIEEASGDYLLFLDNDIFISPASVRKLLEEINGCDIAFPTVEFENGVRMYPRTNADLSYMGVSCAFIISKNAIDKMIGAFAEAFDETYQFYMEDRDFFLRCKISWLKSKHVPEAVAVHMLKSKVSNQAEKYYFRIRNMVYFQLKTGLNISLVKFLLKNFFVNCMLNYSERLRYQEDLQSSTIGKKIRLLFNHPRMVEKRMDLFKAFFKGLWWNFKNYKHTLRKREEFKSVQIV